MAEDKIPRGLVLFRPGTPAEVRRRRLLLSTILIAATLSVVWPIYAVFSGTFPLVLGLPLSLAWPVAWLVVVFLALLWVFRRDG